MRRLNNQIVYLKYFNKIMYFISIINVDINRCFLFTHKINSFSNMNIYFIIDFRLFLLKT